MEFIYKFCNPNIRDLERPLHGGNIFEKYSKTLIEWKDLIDFSTNINPLGPSKEALNAIQNNLWQISYYPETTSQLLREEISIFFNKQISPESVIVCSGLTELINLTAEVLIRPNNEVLIPVPTYGEYSWAVEKFGGRPMFHFLKAQENFCMDKLIESISPNIRVIYLCNPNNPTARLENPKLLKEIIEYANKNKIFVLVDEAFIDFCDSKSSLVIQINNHPNLIVFRSFTKFFALTGLRIGYGLANKEIIKLLMKGILSWNVNCLAQIGAINSLRDQNYIQNTLKIMNKEREYLLNSLKNFKNIRVFPSATSYILFQLNPEIEPRVFEEKLMQNRIMVRNCGSFKGLDNSFFRIGIKKRADNEKLINIIRKILDEEG
ncbi:MAG: histidinol-phosphate aminotransferase family protein [Candidatus Helarchaeota archaeon]|nr:histidinol-phosphate aminotransferase family protein [Candidatus Helarchaeota archaeon]